VPRYNRFRELLRLPRVTSFERLTSNPDRVRELREVYEGDIDRVDTMVGMFAEPPPEGFGFSDTAFRIFILMASRRLKSDRFFTTDYTADVYTQPGLDWINENTLTRVLLRHYPELKPALRHVKNASSDFPTEDSIPVPGCDLSHAVKPEGETFLFYLSGSQMRTASSPDVARVLPSRLNASDRVAWCSP